MLSYPQHVQLDVKCPFLNLSFLIPDRDFGFVGCYKDVLLKSDAKCSGRRECSIKIPDETFDLDHDCPKDLRRYFEATYTCINGK